MPLDSTLHYPHKTPPAETTWHMVAEDIYWLRFPLPFALNHVHAWALRDGDGWCLIDCGIGGLRMRELWQHLLPTLFENRPITRLLVTHYHPDHVGSASIIEELQQPLLLMNETEWLYARMLALDSTDRTHERSVAAYFTMCGLPAELTAKLLARRSRYADGVGRLPMRHQPLLAGDTVTINGTAWQVMIGSGHSPAMISLFCPSRNIYISSDQVLPGISPNVSVWSYNPYENPLGSFMASLHESAALPADALVLPSHGLPFVGVRERCQWLLNHHHERLELILSACATPQTAHALMRQMFPQALDEHQTNFALGETVAHINYLVESNALRREVDSAGRWLLQTA